MSMEDLYKEVMSLNLMDDNDQKEAAAKTFFSKLNAMEIPSHFNWAEEIFEGLHVRQQPDKTALLWADIHTGESRRFSYAEFAACGNQCLNRLRKAGVKQGDNMYMMTPIMPETWFASYASIKGGVINVPTATTMTVRELEFRFTAYPPDCLVADEAYTEILDEALQLTGVTPKIKLVLGDKEGWVSYRQLTDEPDQAEGAKTGSKDLLFCFFTSGTTGLPKRVGHTATSYPVGHLSTAVMAGIRPDDIHHNLSAPGWAKWAWSSFFAPLNVGATATGFNFKTLDAHALPGDTRGAQGLDLLRPAHRLADVHQSRHLPARFLRPAPVGGRRGTAQPRDHLQMAQNDRHRNPRLLRADRVHRHDRQPPLDGRQDAQRLLRPPLAHVRCRPGGRRGQGDHRTRRAGAYRRPPRPLAQHRAVHRVYRQPGEDGRGLRRQLLLHR